MYEILFSDTALKQLEHAVQARIIAALKRARVRPEAFFVRLVGEPAYKFRVGDYRVLADIEHARLVGLVIKVGHRKNIILSSIGSC
ncbi:type II toxin-antitoxin system RelE/ParE family toxin [Candidatus Woesearchaeota archaeon]|nr:type II toxin-antitoxin system RelE/ParE family toxin [Candidatus Woesearchaeota archaeon]